MGHWPQLFNNEDVRPVKIQIEDDLFKGAEERGIEITKKQITDALAVWCNRLSYLHKCREGGSRFGLNGEEDEFGKTPLRWPKRSYAHYLICIERASPRLSRKKAPQVPTRRRITARR